MDTNSTPSGEDGCEVFCPLVAKKRLKNTKSLLFSHISKICSVSQFSRDRIDSISPDVCEHLFRQEWLQLQRSVTNSSHSNMEIFHRNKSNPDCNLITVWILQNVVLWTLRQGFYWWTLLLFISGYYKLLSVPEVCLFYVSLCPFRIRSMYAPVTRLSFETPSFSIRSSATWIQIQSV